MLFMMATNVLALSLLFEFYFYSIYCVTTEAIQVFRGGAGYIDQKFITFTDEWSGKPNLKKRS